jgi:hypothetical protein
MSMPADASSKATDFNSIPLEIEQPVVSHG